MLELKNITYDVSDEQGSREIIQDLSFQVENGRFVVITGPNGGGKSTIARLIAGIAVPTSGQVFLDGQDITSLSVTERARMGIGYAFQQPVRFKGICVRDLIRIAAGKELSAAEACAYLSEVGLCARDYIDREVNASLSGGELKRIEIATVLARGARLALFDEPEAGIDLWSFQNLIRVFEKMQEKDEQRTILVISHQERILSIADEIIVIAEGKILRRGTPEVILPTLLGTSAAVSGCDKLELKEKKA